MTGFVELLIGGTSLGFIYALIALGFVIIFKSTGVVNFAHGSLLLLGGYAIARLAPEIGFAAAAVAGIAATAALATAAEFAFVRPLRRRGADPVIPAILMIGLDIILLTDLTRRIGSHVTGLGDPWGSSVVHAAGFTIPQARLAAIAVALILMGGFFLAFKFSNWGVAMRSGTEDPEAAALMGIRLGRLSAASWTIAGVLAAVAAVFLTAFPSPGLDNGTGFAALKAVPAAILGGLDSTGGAVAGGLALGIAEALTSGYEDHFAFLGRGVGAITPWVVMLLILLIRPSGLFGAREATRV